MRPRYPGYDVLTKRHGLSWDRITRRVLSQRLAVRPGPVFFSECEWATLQAVCARIVPQPQGDGVVTLAAMVDAKVAQQLSEGYRDARLPPLQQAWQLGLAALTAEAQQYYHCSFAALDGAQQDHLLRLAQDDELRASAWEGMSCAVFFRERVLHDITAAFYAHPLAWNHMGFGGPASPRGYVRLGTNRLDAWEAVQFRPGKEQSTRKRNGLIR